MARMDNQGKIRGTVGQYSYRVVGDQNIVQSKPGKVKQTAGTKESASEFGLASTTAKVIRNCLQALNQNRHDGGMVNRFQQTVYDAIKSGSGQRGERSLYNGDLDKLRGFEFNNKSMVSEILKVGLSAFMDETGSVLVTIPPFHASKDMKFPSKADGFHLRVVVTALNFNEAFYQYIGHQQLNIRAGSAQQSQTMEFASAPPGEFIVLVSLSLHFYKVNNLLGEISLNDKKLNPVSLIGIFKTDQKDIFAASPAANLPEADRHPMSGYFGNELVKKQQRLTEIGPEKIPL